MSFGETNRIRIDVTEEDIQAGRRRNGLQCPLALALQRGLGRMVVVNYASYSRPCPGVAEPDYRYLPSDVVRWRIDFDAGKPVSPFSFEIDDTTTVRHDEANE